MVTHGCGSSGGNWDGRKTVRATLADARVQNWICGNLLMHLIVQTASRASRAKPKCSSIYLCWTPCHYLSVGWIFFFSYENVGWIDATESPQRSFFSHFKQVCLASSWSSTHLPCSIHHKTVCSAVLYHQRDPSRRRPCPQHLCVFRSLCIFTFLEENLQYLKY